MALPADHVLARLKSGAQRFRKEMMAEKRRNARHHQELERAQNPFAVVLTCADSRVVPELLFDADLGDLFVIRVAGNVPNPSTIASIEFAVTVLNVKLILVLAHENCGAVQAAIAGDGVSKNLKHLLGFIEPAVVPGDEDANSVARRNARNTASALVSESAIIASAVAREGARIVTAYYRLGSGEVEFD